MADSGTKNERKSELECLRLASDFKQLASATPDRDLKVHCLRMAKLWSDQAAKGPTENIPMQRVSYH